MWRSADEGRHDSGPDATWAEAWWFDAWTASGALGATTGMVLLPNQQRAWYWAALVRVGSPLLLVVDVAVPLPRGLGVRAEGLWADHTCEAPFEQWTVANEAHALALDDPSDLRGVPTPMAFDLEWYAAAPPTARPDGYEQRGEVDGVIELADGPLPIVGPAARGHTWGALAWDDRPAGAISFSIALDDGSVIEHGLTEAGWWRRLVGVSLRRSRWRGG